MVSRVLARKEWEDLKPLSRKPTKKERAEPRGKKLSGDAEKMIENLIAYGFSLKQIYDATGVHKSSLRSMKDRLAGAGHRKDLDVIDSAWLQAVGGPEKKWHMADGSMTRFWLERRLGWRPPIARSVAVNANLDLNRLSDAQLETLEQIMEAASGGGDAG